MFNSQEYSHINVLAEPRGIITFTPEESVKRNEPTFNWPSKKAKEMRFSDGTNSSTPLKVVTEGVFGAQPICCYAMFLILA